MRLNTIILYFLRLDLGWKITKPLRNGRLTKTKQNFLAFEAEMISTVKQSLFFSCSDSSSTVLKYCGLFVERKVTQFEKPSVFVLPAQLNFLSALNTELSVGKLDS